MTMESEASNIKLSFGKSDADTMITFLNFFLEYLRKEVAMNMANPRSCRGGTSGCLEDAHATLSMSGEKNWT